MSPLPRHKFRWPLQRGQSFMLLGCALGLTILWLILLQFDGRIFREHGPMENFQICCLLASGFCVGVLFRKAKAKREHIFLFGLGLLHLTFLAHEFDPRPFGKPLLTFFLRGAFRNGFLLAAWGLGLILFVRNRGEVWKVFTAVLERTSGMILLLSGVFWVLGGAIDKLSPFSPEATMLAEELMETNGALFLLIATVQLWRSDFQAMRLGEAEEPMGGGAEELRL